MESKKVKPIVEEREERMVSVKCGVHTVRKARFLNPFVKSVEEAMKVPPVPPLVSEITSSKSKTWPFKVQFKGWRVPQKKWKQWVDKMVQIHEPIWRKVCIYDAIKASTYEVRKNENVILGLAELWCLETNTFVFPWGEATITLEDMLILGGFSVLGEPVTTSLLDENLLEINNRIYEEWHGFSKQKALKPECSAWMNHFMEMNDTDRNLEHVAFLALWLSRYVFPRHSQDIVGNHVFSVAIHLAQGTRIALAPAVLSSLYRDLGLLICNGSFEVWAPFHLLKMWAWEHFSMLRPKQVNSLHEGEPRVARWHKLSTSAELKVVRSVLKVPGTFRWRCYTEDVINWRHPSFYKEKEMWVIYSTFLYSYMDDESRSFAHCLRACELVGLDCIEQYLPYRVAMQFGLDQDLPGYFTRAHSSWEDAWITYNKSIIKAKFYIPPRLFVSDVTTRYLDWWKESMRHRKTPGNILHQEETHGSVLSKSKKLKLHAEVNNKNCSDDDDEMTLSQIFRL